MRTDRHGIYCKELTDIIREVLTEPESIDIDTSDFDKDED